MSKHSWLTGKGMLIATPCCLGLVMSLRRMLFWWLAEQYDGFGRQELAKVKAALHESERLDANNRMQADSRDECN